MEETEKVLCASYLKSATFSKDIGSAQVPSSRPREMQLARMSRSYWFLHLAATAECPPSHSIRPNPPNIVPRSLPFGGFSLLGNYPRICIWKFALDKTHIHPLPAPAHHQDTACLIRMTSTCLPPPLPPPSLTWSFPHQYLPPLAQLRNILQETHSAHPPNYIPARSLPLYSAPSRPSVLAVPHPLHRHPIRCPTSGRC